MRLSKLLIVLLLVGTACSKDTRKTPKGYEYTVVKDGEGEAGKPGQYLVVNMLFKDGKDSVWNDTRGQEIPMLLALRELSPMDEGIEEIFAVLKKGDSVVFSIPAKVLFEKTWGQPVPNEVDSLSDFTFQIGVTDILDEEQMRTLEQEMLTKLNASQLAKDLEQIDSYLAESNISAEKTASGLRYQITKPGSGDTAAQGSQVSIHYAGYLMDGTLFDTSIESVAKENGIFNEGRPYEPLSLSAGSGQVIRGWEEAILLMNKGSKMRVWIPSTLAYGPQARGGLIKENSILVFDMEMIEIN
ncbi:MAG: FKBP-type peptidyl-prolyl cis-trans isomerase [Cyclobacteriaceae bacterium]